jgi:predicted SprT family Zn-dependent metalloprotease
MKNDLATVAKLAQDLIAQWCPEYKLVWLKALQKLGHCNYRKKEIGLSVAHAEHGSIEQVTDTILHEIAHALAGSGAGHGWKWQQQCRIVGANPTRTSSANEVPMSVYNWNVHCKCPGKVRGFVQQPNPSVWKRRQCRDCLTRDWVFTRGGESEPVALEARPTVRRRPRRYRSLYGRF